LAEESRQSSELLVPPGDLFHFGGTHLPGGLRFYNAQRGEALREVTNELQSIADLKAEQIIAWRGERLDDATSDHDRSSALLDSIHSVVTGRSSPAEERRNCSGAGEFLRYL
jgi:hypothetical protein